MKRKHYVKTASINASRDAAFSWHQRPGALDRLTPPWKDVRVVKPPESLRNGERAVFTLALGPVRKKWVAEHFDYSEGERFCDRQIEGPFAFWEHRHLFENDEHGGSILRDEVTWKLPVHAFSSRIVDSFARSELEALFRYRHATLANDLRQHQAAAMSPSHFLISGSSGLVGTSLTAYLRSAGHTVTRLLREKTTDQDAISWNPESGFENPDRISDFDYVVHLAGAGIADKRWTTERKRLIRDSRVNGTRTLVSSLLKSEKRPRALLCASAIGIYGEAGDNWVDESSIAATDYMAGTTAEWENETRPAAEAGIRVVNLRLGIVLTPRGGALGKMLPAFRFGIGGRLGNGRMIMSWISIDDVLGAIEHCAANDGISGPVNLAAPHPVSNAAFTKTLARVLGRPVGPPVPAFALRMALGELANAALLKSTRVRPARLLETGYEFTHPHLEECLRHLLGR